jgi:hypothetical protein
MDSARITKAERAKTYCENALRVFGLD